MRLLRTSRREIREITMTKKEAEKKSIETWGKNATVAIRSRSTLNMRYAVGRHFYTFQGKTRHTYYGYGATWEQAFENAENNTERGV